MHEEGLIFHRHLLPLLVLALLATGLLLYKNHPTEFLLELTESKIPPSLKKALVQELFLLFRLRLTRPLSPSSTGEWKKETTDYGLWPSFSFSWKVRSP